MTEIVLTISSSGGCRAVCDAAQTLPCAAVNAALAIGERLVVSCVDDDDDGPLSKQLSHTQYEINGSAGPSCDQ